MNPSEAIRKYNMAYLRLDDAQYALHESMMAAPMDSWGDSAWQYVKNESRKYGVSGDVISSLLADWIRLHWNHAKGGIE